MILKCSLNKKTIVANPSQKSPQFGPYVQSLPHAAQLEETPLQFGVTHPL